MNQKFIFEQGCAVHFVPTAGYIATSFRTLQRFNVLRAASVAEAVSALDASERPAVLAGGTDLPAGFNEGFSPSDLIDISRIDALRQVKLTRNAIEIGATVTHAFGSASPLIREHLPSFAGAWARIANIRVRLSATLGGNLMARRTRYEGSILLSALGARARLQSAAGEAEFAVEDLWTAQLPRAALLTTIVIPLRKGLRLDYARDLRPIMTQAVAIDGERAGRVVTATEYVVPCVRAVNGDAADGDIGFDDPVTSLAYIKQVGATLLGRQLERLKAP